MAVACMSLMGSKKASSIAAIGVIVVLMGLCHVQEVDAAATIVVLNVSPMPVSVTATVNATIVGSVVAGANANVSLALLPPLNTSANAVVNLTITNIPSQSSVSTLVSANVNTAILVTSTLLLAKVKVILGSLLAGIFVTIRVIVPSL